MKKTHSILTVAVLMFVLTVTVAQAKVIPNAIWCDYELFGVTVTPQDVPEKGPFDVIYAFNNDPNTGGLEGQRNISETKPGDKDYNGGRWEVTPVTFTAAGLLAYDQDDNGAIDAELMSDAEVAAGVVAGYLTIGDPVRHFLCPLHPQKGD